MPCEKRDRIDERIAHYRRIIGQILNQQFNDRAKALIAELELKKAASMLNQSRSLASPRDLSWTVRSGT
jgi:hypothetical protein